MRSEIVSVTPERAAEWLQRYNTHNRPLRKATVGYYTEQMKKGLWQLTHQGLAFSQDGTLVDGQHRLAAVVESGVPVRFWVFYGVDMGAQIVVDDHTKRTPLDTLHISNVALPGDKAQEFVSIARAMMTSINWDFRWSKTELIEFVEAHRSAITYGLCLFRHGHKKGVTCGTVGGVIARAYYHGLRSRGEEFAEVLYSGEMKSDGDKAAIRLREILLGSSSARGGGATRAMLHKRTERALRAFMDEQPLSKLYPAETELFPMPGEME